MSKLILFMSFILASFSVQAKEGDKIAIILKNANVSELSVMFNGSIELTTPQASGLSSKNQAIIILENFFKSNVPTNAVVLHETSGSTNSMIVLNLTTKNGQYRVTIKGEYKVGLGFVINEFKIT